MRRNPAEILKDALELPADARAALAGSLLDSLDDEIDEGAEQEWSEEIGRRLAEVDSGKVRPLLWAEARRRLIGG